LTIESVSDLETVREDWTRLALGQNVFATWEWADAWRRHLGAGRELSIGVLRRSDGEATAILPLSIEHRARLRVARFIGSGPADELGALSAGGAGPSQVAAALRHHVADTLAGGGLFLGERIRGSGPLGRELSSAVVHRTASPVLPTHGASFDEFLDSRSRNFRSQVRRRERKLHAAGRVCYRLTEDPDRLSADMRTLMDLHAARWGQPGAFGGSRAAFHLDFAARALHNGWLQLWILELDDRPVAAWYGLRYGGIEFYYQAGRDPAFDSLHVGFVLLNHTIRCAFDDGMREYRLGRGDEPYKSRFAEHDPGLETVAFAAGIRGELALAGVRALLRFPPGTRRAARRVATSLRQKKSGPGAQRAASTAAAKVATADGRAPSDGRPEPGRELRGSLAH
jgi:CelD/BcsL family acetyltransferase involved in cellulose biosynthesis